MHLKMMHAFQSDFHLPQVRPPVEHRFGCGPLEEGEATPTVRVFKHRLLQHFMLSLFCKLPVLPMTRIRDMRTAFMVRTSPVNPQSPFHAKPLSAMEEQLCGRC